MFIGPVFFVIIMLNSFFFTFKFHRFCQSGFYLDFFTKKLAEVFVRNVFIYSAQFFAEKYMIEVLTRKIFDQTFWKLNKYWGWSRFFYSTFFIQVLSFLFYGLTYCFIFMV